jgi:hypothetical protein
MSMVHISVGRSQQHMLHSRLIFKVSHYYHGIEILYYTNIREDDEYIRHALVEIAQLREAFYGHRKYPEALLLLPIIFEREPNSVEELPCALVWKKSSFLMLHHNSTRKLMEMVDAVSSRGDNTVRQAQKQLITELQVYLDHLDEMIAGRWQQRKQELGILAGVPQARTMEDMNSRFIHQTCKH